MPSSQPPHLDAVLFGGGIAGLWLLSELTRQCYPAVLCENHSLGHPQTVGSQGIIHGGLKYTLKGLFTPSADRIKEMPVIWRQCLADQRHPHLAATRLRSDHCHLWRTESFTSKLAMVGARAKLRVAPKKLDRSDWPAPLRDCPGEVYQLDEQVISPTSCLEALAAPLRDRLIQIDPATGVTFKRPTQGQIADLTLHHGDHTLTLRANRIIFIAGAGNAALRAAVGLSTDVMQRRPLQMVLCRGRNLPWLNGHCVDRASTRVTITSDTDRDGRTVWQVGGQVSEDGVNMDRDQLITHARREVEAAVPNVDLTDTQWATYRIDRAEGLTPGGLRPDGPTLHTDGNVLTAWPTKLALAPVLAERIVTELPDPQAAHDLQPFADWPRPTVALPPWDTIDSWTDCPSPAPATP